MTISKKRASLFTKDNCAPCLNTKAYIWDLYEEILNWPMLDWLTVFRKEDHPALIASFDIDLYPTLIIHQDGVEISRVVGGKNIQGNIRYILSEINQENYTNQ
jgi:hypothetical protein